MEDLLHFMAQQSEAIHILQQQLVAQNTPKLEIASPPKFDGAREAVVGFINVCHLYTEARLEEVNNKGKISWVLSYVQGVSGDDSQRVSQGLALTKLGLLLHLPLVDDSRGYIEEEGSNN